MANCDIILFIKNKKKTTGKEESVYGFVFKEFTDNNLFEHKLYDNIMINFRNTQPTLLIYLGHLNNGGNTPLVYTGVNICNIKIWTH